MYSPFLHSAHHRLRSTQFPARGAHRHAQTQSHTGPCRAEKQVQTRSILSLPAERNCHLRHGCFGPVRMQPQEHNNRAACSLHTQPSIDNHTRSSPASPEITTLTKPAGHRDAPCPRPGHLDQRALLHSVFLGTETGLKSQLHARRCCARTIAVPWAHTEELKLTVTSLSSCTQ